MGIFDDLGILVDYLLYATGLLFDLIDFVPIFFNWVPAEAFAVLIAIFPIAAVYKLMGWSG